MSPAPAHRSDIYQKFLRTSSSKYHNMVDRVAEKGLVVPFTLAEFRSWMQGKTDWSMVVKCEYTGELIPIENASVDHDIPLSRGGLCGLSNLVLCTLEANKAKSDWTGDEFRKLLGLVLSLALPSEVETRFFKRLAMADAQRYGWFARQKAGKR